MDTIIEGWLDLSMDDKIAVTNMHNRIERLSKENEKLNSQLSDIRWAFDYYFIYADSQYTAGKQEGNKFLELLSD